MTLSRLRALLCASALLVVSVPLVVAAPAAQADTGGTTVDGSWHPWNPIATDNGDGTFTGSYDESRTPSVTVDRTTNLGDEVVQVSWKNFTPSSNNPTYFDTDGKPSAQPSRANPPILYGVSVYQCRGTHPTRSPNLYRGADGECYREVAEPTASDGEFGQNNGQKSVTQNDGTGSVSFHVENATGNDLLRCSSSQPCSIVVVPNQGGMQAETDPNEDISGCDDHSSDFDGPTFPFDYFADQHFETSPCAWSKRIVVPLQFARVADSCPNSSVGFTAVGSPALRRGLGQLLAGWCRGRGAVNFDYNFSSNEYLARSRFAAASGGLGSATDVALVTQPADPATAGDKRFVYAPVANDAVAIPYQIDNQRTGRPIDDLRLNARLVAKLLTQSYSPASWDCDTQRRQIGKPAPWCAPAVSGNPASIFDDPEFAALNFRGDHPDRESFPAVGNGVGEFFPTVASGDSDLTYELTRWVVSDPDAHSFLLGRPDLFGMRINKNYLPDRGQQSRGETLYPTSAFQPLDPGWDAPKKPFVAGTYPNDPRTYQGFQGSWNPISSLQLVATTLIGNRSTASQLQGQCYDAQGNLSSCPEGTKTIPVQFKKALPEAVGVRGLTAVTDNTDAQSYRFPTAQLVTRTGSAVGPTKTSMTNALAAMRTNPDKVTQYVDHNTSPGNAYPVMLPVYAMVPTCGISKTKAKSISAMLRRVTTSQTYGLAPGTLAAGLVKLTSKQLAQTRAAAAAVSARSCATAPRDTTNAGAPMRDTGGSHRSRPASNRPVANPAATTAAPAPTTAPSPTASPAPGSVAAKNAGYAIKDDAGSISVLLPLLLGLGAAALLGSPAVWWVVATPAGRAALNRLRPRR